MERTASTCRRTVAEGLERLLTAYAPLARGRVTGDRFLERIGETYGKSVAQVAHRRSLDWGRIVIPKSSGKEHLREDFDVFDSSFADGELDRIDALDAGERLGWTSRRNESWPTQWLPKRRTEERAP